MKKRMQGFAALHFLSCRVSVLLVGDDSGESFEHSASSVREPSSRAIADHRVAGIEYFFAQVKEFS